MYRVRLRELDTGNEILAWETYSLQEHEYVYYKDIECTERVDKNKYEEVPEENDRSPWQLFGIEHGKGWYPLIKPLIEYIDKYNEEHPSEPIHIIQCKEKYGFLHFYVSHGTRELFDMINEAEAESQYICEFCGTREHVGQTQGWNMTICHDCCKNMAVERKFGSYKWLSYDDEKMYWIKPEPDAPDEYICTKEEYEENLP